VVEVGAGLGSLTVALAATGAEVVAVEIDERLAPAIEEATRGEERVRVVVGDALRLDWATVLGGAGPWSLVANLPYNVAVPVVMRVLETEPRIRRLLVMVQREVGERLAAGPRDEHYGAVSLRVAYRAEARVVRKVPRTVFWPQPNVESVLVQLVRRPPPVRADREVLFDLVRVAFEQRRKTMRGALTRWGLDSQRALDALAACGVSPTARPEELGLGAFACLARQAMRS
jgi:16S rRNA (adenine1518-N6/adenine1519-N6)-dimethyltransferase